jgi:hypothetical protein
MRTSNALSPTKYSGRMREPRDSRSGSHLLHAFLIAMLCFSAACGDTDPEAAAPADETYEGLSREELQQQIESMTPQQAESLGIVDTTILMQPPMDPDSVLPEGQIPTFSPDTT